MRLSGKTAIVTGGYRGLGLAVVKAFLQEGARVAVCGRSIENLKMLDTTLTDYEGAYLWTQCDITSALQVSNFIKKVIYEFNSVDILVNNAAIFGQNKTLIDYDSQLFNDVITTNLVGAFNMVQCVIPHMLEQNYGKIITVGGGLCLEDTRIHGGAYHVSKMALEGIASILSHEYKETNLSSNIVNPMGLKRDENNPFYDAEENESLMPPEEAIDLFLYLASVESNGITGKSMNAKEWVEEHRGEPQSSSVI